LDVRSLLARYEARGDEHDFVAAKPLFEQAIAEAEDARLLTGYGYLLESHARNELRQAVDLYERAIELDPDDDKPHYQLIGARAGLRGNRNGQSTCTSGAWPQRHVPCASTASSPRPISRRTRTRMRLRSSRLVSPSRPMIRR
jgi:hypothetical protein